MLKEKHSKNKLIANKFSSKQKFEIAVIAFCMSLFAIIISILFFTSFFVYVFDPPVKIIKGEDSVSLNNNVLDYINSRDDNLAGVFRNKEKIHLEDVKDVLNKLKIIFLILFLILIFLIAFIYRCEKNKFNLKFFFKKTAFLLLLLNGLLLFFFSFIALTFTKSFSFFHQILFKEGSWLFFKEDVLIMLYPEQFFVKSLLLIILIFVIVSLILFALNYFFLSRIKA